MSDAIVSRMRTNNRKPESKLRDFIKVEMSGRWIMTWHEDREVNPGVPDISYVMSGGDYETGWLELKSVENVKKETAHFEVQPSQHFWISNHHSRIPVHFLCSVDMLDFYLVPGSQHIRLAAPIHLKELESISIVKMHADEVGKTLASFLRQSTLRGRHASE